MTLAFTTTDLLPLDPAGPHEVGRPQLVRLGDEAEFLIASKGGLEPLRIRFGMTVIDWHSERLISTAFEEHLTERDVWLQMIQQRLAVPVLGYGWQRNGWVRTGPAWTLGHYKLHGKPGAVLITELDRDGRRPVLVDGATAKAWLEVPRWDALKVLRGAERLPLAA